MGKSGRVYYMLLYLITKALTLTETESGENGTPEGGRRFAPLKKEVDGIGNEEVKKYRPLREPSSESNDGNFAGPGTNESSALDVNALLLKADSSSTNKKVKPLRPPNTKVEVSSMSVDDTKYYLIPHEDQLGELEPEEVADGSQARDILDEMETE